MVQRLEERRGLLGADQFQQQLFDICISRVVHGLSPERGLHEPTHVGGSASAASLGRKPGIVRRQLFKSTRVP
jgi:hypothetical protein